jgi:hypothetical protein
MREFDQTLLMPYAKKYVWWKKPEEAVRYPDRIIAQVMNIGDYTDVQNLINQIGEDTFRDVIKHAEVGQFSEKSWHYWHYRLNISQYPHIAPMPTRRLE